jgi:hypothetical protein
MIRNADCLSKASLTSGGGNKCPCRQIHSPKYLRGMLLRYLLIY